MRSAGHDAIKSEVGVSWRALEGCPVHFVVNIFVLRTGSSRGQSKEGVASGFFLHEPRWHISLDDPICRPRWRTQYLDNFSANGYSTEIFRTNWNYTEKIGMALAQGSHAQIEKSTVCWTTVRQCWGNSGDGQDRQG